MNRKEHIASELRESARLKEAIAEGLTGAIKAAAELIASTFRDGHKVLLAGNGGSAADAQHLAAELMGHYRLDRPGLPAIALTTDTSILTALANDDGYETVFSRQVAALAEAGDLLILLSTSGNSPSIIRAAEEARRREVAVVCFTGETGGALRGLASVLIDVPSRDTARVQEAHITIGHIICGLAEESLS